MLNVKKEEADDDVSPPECKSTHTEFLQLAKPEDAPPSSPMVAGRIKQEVVAHEPPETEPVNDCEVGDVDELIQGSEVAEEEAKGEGVVWEEFGEEYVPIHRRSAAGFHPLLVVSKVEAPLCELMKKTREEVNQGMPLVRLEMKEVGDELEGDHSDGLPPGWEPAAVKDGRTKEGETLKEDTLGVVSGGDEKEIPAASSEETAMEHAGEEVSAKKRKFDEGRDGEDGPPPGWEVAAAVKDEGNTVADVLSGVTRLDEGVLGVDQLHAAGEGDDEDRPPPGWEATVIKDEGVPVPPASLKSISLEVKMEEAQGPMEDESAAPDIEIDDEDDDGPPPGWEAAATKDGGAGEDVVMDESSKPEKGKEKEHLPPFWGSNAAPRPPLPHKAQSPITETGQVVCGSCRSLLSYLKGAKYVQCLCCQTVSFVLEAHQVGQVYCESCSVLLMYRFGSPAVKCSGCKFITQIGPNNRRPPLSEQGVTLQSQLAQLRPRPTTNLAQ